MYLWIFKYTVYLMYIQVSRLRSSGLTTRAKDNRQNDYLIKNCTQYYYENLKLGLISTFLCIAVYLVLVKHLLHVLIGIIQSLSALRRSQRCLDVPIKYSLLCRFKLHFMCYSISISVIWDFPLQFNIFIQNKTGLFF